MGGEPLAVATQLLQHALPKELAHYLLPYIKHTAAALALAGLLALGAGVAGAAEPIRTFINGRELVTDVSPVLTGGRTLVPARAVFEALGATMDWDAATGTVVATRENRIIELQIDSRAAWVSGRLTILDVPARLVDGRTLVPLRFIGEALGAQVMWNQEQRAVLVDARYQVSRDEERTLQPGDMDVPLQVSPALRILVATALSVEGAPYRWGAAGPKRFDCSGYTTYVFKAAGVELPRTSFEQFRGGVAVDKADLKTGDMVFFTTYAKGASHSGIYLGNDLFISAASSTGVSVDSMNSPYWSKRYIGARRYELPASEPAGG